MGQILPKEKKKYLMEIFLSPTQNIISKKLNLKVIPFYGFQINETLLRVIYIIRQV